MNERRPVLTESLNAGEFRRYYWLKEELCIFCRDHGIPAYGPKTELADRIERFLTTGKVFERAPVMKQRSSPRLNMPLSLDTVITTGYTNNEANRAFFQSVTGRHFHFTTRFMRFCRDNPEKTFGDAVAEWKREHEERKTGAYRTAIAPQFEYNRFVREYIAEHPERSFRDAVSAWNEHKQKPKEERK